MIKGDSLLVVKKVLGSLQTKNPKQTEGLFNEDKEVAIPIYSMEYPTYTQRSQLGITWRSPKGTGGRSDGSKEWKATV